MNRLATVVVFATLHLLTMGPKLNGFKIVIVRFTRAMLFGKDEIRRSPSKNFKDAYV